MRMGFEHQVYELSSNVMYTGIRCFPPLWAEMAHREFMLLVAVFAAFSLHIL